MIQLHGEPYWYVRSEACLRLDTSLNAVKCAPLQTILTLVHGLLKLLQSQHFVGLLLPAQWLLDVFVLTGLTSFPALIFLESIAIRGTTCMCYCLEWQATWVDLVAKDDKVLQPTFTIMRVLSCIELLIFSICWWRGSFALSYDSLEILLYLAKAKLLVTLNRDYEAFIISLDDLGGPAQRPIEEDCVREEKLAAMQVITRRAQHLHQLLKRYLLDISNRVILIFQLLQLIFDLLTQFSPLLHPGDFSHQTFIGTQTPNLGHGISRYWDIFWCFKILRRHSLIIIPGHV